MWQKEGLLEKNNQLLLVPVRAPVARRVVGGETGKNQIRVRAMVARRVVGSATSVGATHEAAKTYHGIFAPCGPHFWGSGGGPEARYYI